MELRLLICWMVITQKDNATIHIRTIYVITEEECRKKFAKLNAVMKTEVFAAKERLKEIAVAS